MSQRVNHQKLRLWVGSFIEFQSHVGSFLSVHHLHAPFITLRVGLNDKRKLVLRVLLSGRWLPRNQG